MGNRRQVASPLRPDRDLTILIPARAGSKRIPGKNTKLLGGKPLIQWTIDAAKAANVARIIVSTDDDHAAHLAHEAGCELHPRKAAHATDTAPDFMWVSDIRIATPYFAICRPTSPFRTAGTIRRGYATLLGSRAHSIRAVEPATEHPGKMWMLDGRLMRPLMPEKHPDGTPFHSSPTQSLPPVYKQNASLEMGQTWIIGETQTISGTLVAPFLTDALEGFDLNTPEQWAVAERLALDLADHGVPRTDRPV